jgi:hypothetical protein
MTDFASGWSDAGLLNPAIRHPVINSTVSIGSPSRVSAKRGFLLSVKKNGAGCAISDAFDTIVKHTHVTYCAAEYSNRLLAQQALRRNPFIDRVPRGGEARRKIHDARDGARCGRLIFSGCAEKARADTRAADDRGHRLAVEFDAGGKVFDNELGHGCSRSLKTNNQYRKRRALPVPGSAR